MSMGTYTLDGVPLDDPAGRWGLSDATLLGPLPAPALSAVKIPGVHGATPIPPTVRDAGSHTVGLLVTDNNAAGAVTGDHQQVRANVAALFALAAPLGRLPALRYYPSGDTGAAVWREAAVRLLAAVEPELADPCTATMVLPFDLPAVFWRENVQHTFTSASVATWAIAPPQLVGSTGAIPDPVFWVGGPLTSVTITDAASGKTLTWSGALASHENVRLHADTLEAFKYVDLADAVSGGVDVSGGLSTGPGGFDLNPDPGQAVGWTLARIGGAGVNIASARRSFL